MKIIKNVVVVSVFVFMASAVPAVFADQSSVITNRIIGGEESQDGQWPTVVALVRTSNQSLFQRQFCGANLINENWIVTAAHCLFDGFGSQIDPASLRVAMGFTDLADEDNVTEVAVTSIYTHPDYEVGNPSAPHDLALLRLAFPATIAVMELYEGDANAVPDTPAIVAGWGSNDFSNPNQPLYPSRLNQVTVPLVSRAVCNAPQSYDGLIGEGQVCAGLAEGGRDSCLGDSGGPLMSLQQGEYRQVGVVSYGRGCAEPGFYGVYTRLAHYETWINELIGGGAPVADPIDNADPTVSTNSSDKEDSSGIGSIGPMLPFLMMLLAVYTLRRSMLAGNSGSMGDPSNRKHSKTNLFVQTDVEGQTQVSFKGSAARGHRQ